MNGPLIGYCGNNEEHYGVLCECGCCHECCSCHLRNERKARRVAWRDAYVKAVTATPLADVVRDANVILANENLKLRVDKTNKYGLHIVLTAKFGKMLAKLPAKDWTVEALINEARDCKQ